MMAAIGNKPVFCYAYRPLLNALAMGDGGFTVNLMENGVLVYDRYTAGRQVIEEHTFAVPMELATRYQQEVHRASWWLNSLPLHMSAGPQPLYAAMIGLDGCPEMFRMDDPHALINCPFRTERGHYARMMYNLLEDVAGMLARCGLDLRLDCFRWDHNQVISFEEQRQMSQSMPLPRMYG